MYEKCKAQVETELSQVDCYAATTDMWSSRTTDPYISLTVHFITEDFQLKSRCLQTTFFPEDHTSENIATGLREAVAAWGLDAGRQVCITTDDAANMVKAPALNKWTRLQCFGHRLHLAVENAVKNERINRATGVCKKLVCHFSHSWKARVALEKAQKELNLPSHSLISECQTRWGSRQMMMSRILEQQKALTLVLSAEKRVRHLIPTWQDIDVLESVKEDTDLTKKLKSEILDYLNEKYEDEATQELLNMASSLDPRFKMEFISADNKPKVKARLTSQMLECQVTSSSSTEVEPKVADTSQAKKAKKSLGSFL
ncbi:hypothetical protein SRHO_G00103440 [Serrasalmus rhombeus]